VLDSTRAPLAPGERESLEVAELNDGAWCFAIKTADEAANWSEMSNVATRTLRDTIPPAQVGDLTTTMVTAGSMRLEWTAPGDDESWGQAVAYDLRYALEPITAENWEQAVRVENVAAPGISGTRESRAINVLDPATSYWFALKAIDNAGLESPLSNVVARTTADVTQLTSSAYCPYGCGAYDPAWSPDGARIGCIESWIDGRDIHVFDPDDGTGFQVTRDAWASTFCWSSDGAQMLYATYIGGLFLIDAAPDGTPAFLAEPQWWEEIAACAWSPDGDRIAYTAALYSEGYDVGGEIYVMDLPDGTPRKVFHDNVESPRGLQWTPDGRRLLFGSRKAGTLDLWTAPADGGSAVRITDDPGYEYEPTCSSDGHIAFVGNREGISGIWMMDANGDDPILLVKGPVMQPSLAPDGKALIYCGRHDELIFDIYLVRWE